VENAFEMTKTMLEWVFDLH